MLWLCPSVPHPDTVHDTIAHPMGLSKAWPCIHCRLLPALHQGTALVDLSDQIGQLACKVPKSVNLTSTLQKLTGTLKVVTAAQLKQLPDLVKLTVSVKPQALLVSLDLGVERVPGKVRVVAAKLGVRHCSQRKG